MSWWGGEGYYLLDEIVMIEHKCLSLLTDTQNPRSAHTSRAWLAWQRDATKMHSLLILIGLAVPTMAVAPLHV